MSLDIAIMRKEPTICPHCHELVFYDDVEEMSSSGRCWYEFLENVGYYVPYEKRTEDNDWYGKGMELTNEEARYLVEFAKNSGVFNYPNIERIVAVALMNNQRIVINANW